MNDTQAELDAITREMDVIYERWPKKEDRPKREELLTPLRARCVEIGQRRYRIAARKAAVLGHAKTTALYTGIAALFLVAVLWVQGSCK